MNDKHITLSFSQHLMQPEMANLECFVHPKPYQVFVLTKDLEIRSKDNSSSIIIPAGVVFHTVPGVSPENIKVRSAEGCFQMELKPEEFKRIFSQGVNCEI